MIQCHVNGVRELIGERNVVNLAEVGKDWSIISVVFMNKEVRCYNIEFLAIQL